MNDDLRILVPLDGSAEAEAALPLSAPLFRARPVRLTLFRVTAPDESAAAARDYLGRVRDALRPHQVAAETRVEWGAPAEEILWLAKTGGFDLVAMTTHGRGGLRRWFGGSVAEEVVRHAEIPVLLNRPGQPLPPWTRFVVPLDGSPLAERILPDALRLARLFGAELQFLEAVMPPLVMGREAGFLPYLPPADPTPYLRGLCDRAAREGVAARPVARVGPSTREILRHLEESKAGLVCMTTHGRTGLARLAFGSTAEQILRHATCPVLLRRVLAAEAPVDVARR